MVGRVRVLPVAVGWQVGEPPLAREARVETPLPGGLGAVVRFFFNVPQWIQITGLVAGLIIATVLLIVLWRRRAAIRDWLVSRSGTVRIWLAVAAAVLAIGIVGFGTASWNYVQHANEFCQGCHVMTTAYQRFLQSEHSRLGCHECHRQSIYASARQLYLWVAERPEEIGPHAPVPNAICAECHIRERPDRAWERISATAGHRVHLESPDTALAGLQCVTCHGAQVHRFVPADATCGQSGCHEDVDIRLGRMSGQTALHCVTCHEFTAGIDEHLPVDTARLALLPGASECLSCHAMTQLMSELDPERDPHRATCGVCHDPHAQATPEAAFGSCEQAGCHTEPEALTPFHRGLPGGVVADCATCHEAHEWVVEGGSCESCHAPSARREAAAGRRPSSAGFAMIAGAGWWPPESPQASDSFRHAQHNTVGCTACHDTAASHGAVTVRTPADCAACHHTPRAAADCVDCHTARETAGVREVPIRMALDAWPSPRTRALPFDHARHESIACAECHTEGLDLAVGRGCADCHDEHHSPRLDCMACHATPPADAHTREVHTTGCAGSGCHTGTAYAEMGRTRNFCLSCHQDQTDHQPGEGCADCHAVR